MYKQKSMLPSAKYKTELAPLPISPDPQRVLVPKYLLNQTVRAVLHDKIRL